MISWVEASRVHFAKIHVRKIEFQRYIIFEEHCYHHTFSSIDAEFTCWTLLTMILGRLKGYSLSSMPGKPSSRRASTPPSSPAASVIIIIAIVIIIMIILTVICSVNLVSGQHPLQNLPHTILSA